MAIAGTKRMSYFCKDSASERKERSLSICRAQPIFCKIRR
ncbi:hypothetical protein HMPREF0971_02470 [Segatella oris F0302]|uniref:Uncharacterized protein n=1 Tax=Segatella oris F0302 TaxID=649760 RepID=D1QTY8_9BACT|nr:hypothetical protein HMPREF0971_02470 [Segatella oris F0302]